MVLLLEHVLAGRPRNSGSMLVRFCLRSDGAWVGAEICNYCCRKKARRFVHVHTSTCSCGALLVSLFGVLYVALLCVHPPNEAGIAPSKLCIGRLFD